MLPDPCPRISGFVLAGGQSRRMGVDKAMLAFRGETLIQHAAEIVGEAAGNVTIIGPPERYAWLGLQVIPDERPGFGPLGGVVTALSISEAEWALVVGCDLPNIDAGLLRRLIALTTADSHCIVPESPNGLEPLCAVWHRSALPQLRCALAAERLKMKMVVRELNARIYPVADPRLFRNINTPEDLIAGHE
jgi:molybdenum cofactor guanylyltransferase